MAKNTYIQQFGYTEMYEWATIPPSGGLLGYFVQFNKRYPNRIERAFEKDAKIAGVTTICSVLESDNPDYWKGTYMTNDVGDVFMREETLAIGVKCYDQDLEFSYMSTRPWKHYVKVLNKEYDPNQKYVERTARREWVRCTLIGKANVIDNGTCKAGGYCKPYVGDDMQLAGTAVPCDKNDDNACYVLDRVSDKSIQILINAF